jgi:hypothetical protein
VGKVKNINSGKKLSARQAKENDIEKFLFKRKRSRRKQLRRTLPKEFDLIRQSTSELISIPAKNVHSSDSSQLLRPV